jgi:hypothetical protein
MGRKGYEYDKYILEALNLAKTRMSGKELLNYVLIHATGEPRYPKKTFDEALIKLLENEDIKVVGYKPEDDVRDKKQAFKSAPVLFDSSKRLTRPEIQKSVLNMYENEEDYQKIKFLFQKRRKDLIKYYDKLWENLIDKTTSYPIKTVLNLIQQLYGSQKIQEGYNGWFKNNFGFMEFSHDICWNSPKFKLSILGITPVGDFEIEYVLAKKIEELVSSNNGDNAWFWTYPCDADTFKDIWISASKVLKKNKVLEEPEDIIMDIIYNPFKLNLGKKWHKEEAVYMGGFTFFHLNQPLVFPFFEKVVDIISTYPNEERDILLKVLAKGLSDEPVSLIIFHEFYTSMQKLRYSDRLKTVLGLLNKDAESYTKELDEANKKIQSLETQINK